MHGIGKSGSERYFFPSLPFWAEGPKRQRMRNADLCLHKKALQRLGFVRGKFLQGTSNVLKMYAKCIKNVLKLYPLLLHVQNLIDFNEVELRA